MMLTGIEPNVSFYAFFVITESFSRLTHTFMIKDKLRERASESEAHVQREKSHDKVLARMLHMNDHRH